MNAYRRHDDLKFRTIPPSWRLTLVILKVQLSNVAQLVVRLVKQFVCAQLSHSRGAQSDGPSAVDKKMEKDTSPSI